MPKLIVTLLLCLCVHFLSGQSSPAPAIPLSKIEKIRTMLELMGAGNMGEQAAKRMIDSYKQALPTVPADFWEEVKKEIKAEDLENLVIPIYDKYYTEEDLEQLIAFYNTPIGKKMRDVTSAIMNESMEAGQAWGKQVGEKVMQKLKDKGYQ